METAQRALGTMGESFVAEHLERAGFTIRARNYTRRGGEIDLIAEKDCIRAFVEVKIRTNEYFYLSQLITPSKQRKIVSTAYLYNAEHGWQDNLIHRFDVALLIKKDNDYTLTYIPNAFAPKEDTL